MKGIPSVLTTEAATLTYYLIYSENGNDPIPSTDIHRWKYQLFTTIFRYGPTWWKRLDLQEKLRELSDEELRAGGTAIYNAADNPDQEPTTQSTDELNFIKSQNVTKHLRSKIEAYDLLNNLLETDVTGDYLKQFKKLFSLFLEPSDATVYKTEDGDVSMFFGEAYDAADNPIGISTWLRFSDVYPDVDTFLTDYNAQ